MAPRFRKLSQSQKEALVTFMELHPNLRKKRFSKTFTRKKADFMWKSVTVSLNSLPGSKKDCRQWQKTWQGLKSTAKGKASEINRNITQSNLSDLDNRIIVLLGMTAVKGHQDIEESPVQFVRLFANNFSLWNLQNIYYYRIGKAGQMILHFSNSKF